jgi:acetylglutamate kinase
MDNHLMDTHVLQQHHGNFLSHPTITSYANTPVEYTQYNPKVIPQQTSSTLDDIFEEETFDDEDDEGGIEDEIDQHETQKFKELVKKWIVHDNNIRKLSAALRDQRKILKELTPEILKFMKDHEIEGLYDNEGQSTLQFKVSKRKESLNQKTIKEKLANYLQSEDKAQEVTNYIVNNRAEKEVINLRRIFNKK